MAIISRCTQDPRDRFSWHSRTISSSMPISKKISRVLTPYTETDPKALRERLRTIRKQRYAVTIADVQLFTASMAAPVFDRRNEVVACVCFVTRKSTMTGDERRSHLLEKLLETAQSDIACPRLAP